MLLLWQLVPAFIPHSVAKMTRKLVMLREDHSPYLFEVTANNIYKENSIKKKNCTNPAFSTVEKYLSTRLL
jgi:hypothetical protein